MNKGLTIALLASLALNVLAIGFLAGRHFGAPHAVMHESAHFGGPMRYDVAVLDEDERRAFHAIFHGKRGELKTQQDEAQRLRRAFGAALAADPFDRARAEAALGALRAVEGAQQAALGALLIDAFENLSAEDRKALVAAQAGRHGHFGRRLRGQRRADAPPDDEAEPAAPPRP